MARRAARSESFNSTAVEAPPNPGDRRPESLSAMRLIVAFGVVSLLADFVYEGARSIVGP